MRRVAIDFTDVAVGAAAPGDGWRLDLTTSSDHTSDERSSPTRRSSSHFLSDPLVGLHVLVDHPLDRGSVLDGGWTAARSSFAAASTAATASASDATRKPFSPGRTSSGIDPRAVAIAGVPQAIASTTLNPNGSSKLTRCSGAAAPPRSSLRPRRRRARRPHALAVDQWRDEPLEVVPVLDDPGDHERHSGGPATRTASTAPLSGWIRPKKSRCPPPPGPSSNCCMSIPSSIVAR